MEDDMAAMFPNGIRTLILDDDTKFLKSATMLLSLLNFDVASPLFLTPKSLTSGDLKGFDVILVHAAKAAACSFDFHAIMEADLLISISSTVRNNLSYCAPCMGSRPWISMIWRQFSRRITRPPAKRRISCCPRCWWGPTSSRSHWTPTRCAASCEKSSRFASASWRLRREGVAPAARQAWMSKGRTKTTSTSRL
nr:uncharacterized protein LOC117867002 isoform X1 [Setaria viridis]